MMITGDILFWKHDLSSYLRAQVNAVEDPHGTVQSGRVILGYEGRNDPDSIKRSIADQEKQLKQYAEWSKSNVDAHDAQLPGLLKNAVGRRRKSLEELNRLSDF